MLLDKFNDLLNENKTSEETALGLSFYLGIRVTLLLPHELEELKNEKDLGNFISERIEKFIKTDERVKIFDNFTYFDNFTNFNHEVVRIHKWFGAKLKFKLSENRVNINGESTDLFSPYKEEDFDYKFEPITDFILSEVHHTYEVFFNHLGAALKKYNLVNNNKEAFVFSYYFGQVANEHDQVGFKDFFVLFNNLITPLYSSMLNPEKFEFHADNKDGNKYLPFHYALTNLVGNVEASSIIWNEQRLIFHDQKTGKFINDDFQFLHLSQSRPLLEMLLNNRYMKKDVLEYFKNKSVLFDNEFQSLKKYKKLKNVEFIDHVFNKVKEFWGFDVKKEVTMHANITFFAVTFLCFMYCYVANIDDFEISN